MYALNPVILCIHVCIFFVNIVHGKVAETNKLMKIKFGTWERILLWIMMPMIIFVCVKILFFTKFDSSSYVNTGYVPHGVGLLRHNDCADNDIMWHQKPGATSQTGMTFLHTYKMKGKAVKFTSFMMYHWYFNANRASLSLRMSLKI